MMMGIKEGEEKLCRKKDGGGRQRRDSGGVVKLN